MQAAGPAIALLLTGGLAIPVGGQVSAPAERQVSIDLSSGVLSGTLLVPPSPARAPVVLLIAGPGPTDRDGNPIGLPGKSNSLKLLAESLAAEGIATLRYDKRGIGRSRGVGLTESQLRFEMMVEDAAALTSYLRNDEHFSTVTVAGHSEGSLIGMLAARAARADGFISIAGPARRGSDIIRDQLRPQAGMVPGLWDASETILSRLEAGSTVADVPAELTSLYRASVQPYMISWLRYTPSVEISRLSVPVLIVQGNTDIQVPVTEADLLLQARGDARIAVIGGMNHVLKSVPDDTAAQLASYADPTLPIAPDLPAAVATFVTSVRPFGIRGSRGDQRATAARLSPRITRFATIDGARMAIEYGQPARRGREIWGGLVRWGRTWMPGADEATTLTTSDTLVFGDVVVPPGDYTIYTQPAADAVTLIISRETGQFHTVYSPEQDLGRVPMTMVEQSQPVERLTFSIAAGEGGGGVFTLMWGERGYAAPFVVRR
jgi:hypothetical protein